MLRHQLVDLRRTTKPAVTEHDRSFLAAIAKALPRSLRAAGSSLPTRSSGGRHGEQQMSDHVRYSSPICVDVFVNGAFEPSGFGLRAGCGVLRPKERDRASSAHDVVPPSPRRDSEVDEALVLVETAICDGDVGGVTGVGPCGFDATIDIQRSEDRGESQAQFADQVRCPEVTVKSVGSAENGNAIRISPTRAGRSSSTSMCRSCKSRSNRSTSISSPTVSARAARLGAAPVHSKWE